MRAVLFHDETISVPRPRKMALWLLASEFLLVGFGNLPRFLPLGIGHSNILLTEFFFYFFGILYLVVAHSSARIAEEFYVIAFVTPLSFCVGFLKNGFDAVALLYALRFAFMALSCCAAGHALSVLFGRRIDRALLWSVIYPMMVSSIIGWIIYLAFPDARQLWLALKLYGISYGGDPHQKRFLSAYFDPNFYCTVAVFGILATNIARRITGERRYLAINVSFAASALFTVSRSGLATLVMVYGLVSLANFYGWRITRAKIFGFFAFLALLIAALPLYVDTLTRAWGRLFIIQRDESALDRLITFRFGVQTWLENPFFGIGFNYVGHFFEHFSAFDSSLLQILATMGLVLGTIFIATFALFMSRALMNISVFDEAGGLGRHIALSFGIYIIVSMMFSANFVNLFFYLFWFIPIVSMLSYFCFIAEPCCGVRTVAGEVSPGGSSIAALTT